MILPILLQLVAPASLPEPVAVQVVRPEYTGEVVNERQLMACLATTYPENIREAQAGLISGEYVFFDPKSSDEQAPKNDITFYFATLLIKFCLNDDQPMPRLKPANLDRELRAVKLPAQAGEN